MGLWGYSFALFNVVFALVILGFSIYILVLAIKVMRRGITALDLYIEEKRESRH